MTALRDQYSDTIEEIQARIGRLKRDEKARHTAQMDKLALQETVEILTARAALRRAEVSGV